MSSKIKLVYLGVFLVILLFNLIIYSVIKPRIKFDIKHDSSIFRTFVYFVFDKDLGSIIENSLVYDKSKVIAIK